MSPSSTQTPLPACTVHTQTHTHAHIEHCSLHGVHRLTSTNLHPGAGPGLGMFPTRSWRYMGIQHWILPVLAGVVSLCFQLTYCRTSHCS